MVLVTNKLQGSHVLFPWSPPTRTKGFKQISTVQFVGRKEKHLRLNRSCCFRLESSSCNGGVKAKPFRVTSFKGGIQSNESGGGSSESGKKVTNKNSVKLSYCSDDDDNNSNGSTKAQNSSLSYTSETENSSVTGQQQQQQQPAIQKLFKKWLTLLRTQSPIQVIDEALGGRGGEEEEVQETTKPETKTEIKKTESLESTKNGALAWFWSLDSSIKLPLLLFVPAFVAINTIYGGEVTKELTPLWIFGPLIVALYIKMLQGLCALYAFCFNQTVKVLRNLPSYYRLACQYVSQGKLKDDLFRPLVAIKTTNYREFTRSKLKQFREWIYEMYLDYVESIWPYYCRTIRFLKRANFI